MAKLPDIPSIGTAEASVGVRRVFDAIRRAFTDINRSGGVETGSSVIDRIEQAISSATSGSGSTHTPPKPVGVVATGGFAYITVSWDDPYFDYLAYAEVWRSTGTVISEATRVGTTNATMFSDLPPSQSVSASYHYWVRFVSNDVTPQYGPWSDMVTASTADDPAYVLEVLAGEIEADWFAIRNTSGTDVKHPFVVDATYGVVMDSALIKDGTITNAKIANLSADKIYVSSGTIASAIIGSGHISNAMIGSYISSTNYNGSTSDPYNSPGSAGWCIAKGGGAAFNNVLVRGSIEATSVAANSITTNHLVSNAATSMAYGWIPAAGPSTLTSGTTYALTQCSISVYGGLPVVIEAEYCAEAYTSSPNISMVIGIAKGNTSSLLISRNDPLILTDAGAQICTLNGTRSIRFVDVPASSGTCTYYLTLQVNGSVTAKNGIYNKYIRATEYRR